MASTYGTVTVTTSPTLVVPANSWRKGCLVTNNSNAVVYFGWDTSVTTSSGQPIYAGGNLRNSGERDCWRGDLYFVVGSGTADVRYSEWQGG